MNVKRVGLFFSFLFYSLNCANFSGKSLKLLHAPQMSYFEAENDMIIILMM